MLNDLELFLAVLDSWMGEIVSQCMSDTYDFSISEFRALTIDQMDEETWCDQQEALTLRTI